jgi:hypothetical protein
MGLLDVLGSNFSYSGTNSTNTTTTVTLGIYLKNMINRE